MKGAAVIPAGVDDRWPAGRPAAVTSAFAWKTWEPQCDWSDMVLSSKLKEVQTERVERARANGDDTGTIPGLSRAADELRFATSKIQRHPKKTSMVSIENREAGERSRDKRAALRKAAI